MRVNLCLSFICFHWNFPNTAHNTESVYLIWNWKRSRRRKKKSPVHHHAVFVCLGGAAGADFSSHAMKAMCLIEKSGISWRLKWMSHISKHANDRKCQVTGTHDVCLQTKARLSDSGGTWLCRGTRAIAYIGSSINSFLLFPCPAWISHQLTAVLGHDK